jgi:hypothetical protein
MPAETDVSAAPAEAARSINQHTSLDDTFSTIAAAAQASIPGFDRVGICTDDRPRGQAAGRASRDRTPDSARPMVARIRSPSRRSRA